MKTEVVPYALFYVLIPPFAGVTLLAVVLTYSNDTDADLPRRVVAARCLLTLVGCIVVFGLVLARLPAPSRPAELPVIDYVSLLDSSASYDGRKSGWPDAFPPYGSSTNGFRFQERIGSSKSFQVTLAWDFLARRLCPIWAHFLWQCVLRS